MENSKDKIYECEGGSGFVINTIIIATVIILIVIVGRVLCTQRRRCTWVLVLVCP